MSRDAKRLLTGLTTVLVIAAIVIGAIVMFRGGVAPTASVTVISPRAGLVMNPDAKVKLHGAQVGKVVSIDALPDGQAALKLAMNPDDLQLIPSNTGVEIASSTVFGAKFVQLVPPAE
ncbi:MlaD family protein, partial [Streptomyces millisiae]